jgi:RHS repeat-associated protein
MQKQERRSRMNIGLRMTGWLKLLPFLLLWPASGWTQIVEYYHLDGVGNVLAVTNRSAAVVVEQHDYLPFGQEWCGTGICGAVTAGQPKRFTGKERDAETGLDYFGARYYGSKIGRFTTVDPNLNMKRALLDPQEWNRYAYGRNNPLRFVDPDGRESMTYYWGGNTNYSLADRQFYQVPPVGLADVAIQSGMAASIMGAPLAPAMARAGLIGLGLLGPRVGQMIAGPYGEASRSELETAASAGGPTISVLTRQTSAPEAGRSLSVAAGQGAEALANAAREGGKLYGAAIPRALVTTMEKTGLVQARTTMMQGGAQATEYRFLPQATEFVTKFFTERKQ